MNEVIVLDVGHGNAAIIRHDGETIVVDAPLRDRLPDALRMEGATDVRLAVASHSDSDHCGGFIGLLLDEEIVIHELRINADARRHDKFWEDLKFAAKRAKDIHGTRLRVELTDEISGDLSAGSLALEVLYPPPTMALGGVGSRRTSGRRMTPNAMSAVLRVVLDGEPLVLLPADLDADGLEYLVSNGVEVAAPVLVFPHHGGHPEGASPTGTAEFAEKLIAACQPDTVIFSIGRGRYGTPRPEIVSAVRGASPGCHIACTQLSERCADDATVGESHLSARYASGRQKGHCCLGSAVLVPGIGLQSPQRAAHEAVVNLLPNRLCK